MDRGDGYRKLYATSLGLLTDLYQLTMAQAAWRHKRHELRSVFHLTLRRCPFGGDFAIAAGIEPALNHVLDLRFSQEDLDYLATLASRSGAPLFDEKFLLFLSEFSPRCDVLSVAEGETLLAGSPMVRVEGGLLEAQLLETPLLNLIGVQTLVATRAARICHWAARRRGGDSSLAGQAQSVLEFGLRRAHGVDGAISVSRAAYLGGCSATSNLLAGRLFGIPVSGTHAHSWVLSFEKEIDSFRAYAEAFPSDTTLLVDTFSTERGVKRAAEVGKELADDGHELVGVRLDSGDLARLSVDARRILDENDLRDTLIAASGDLDESRIAELRERGAKIDVWGVGARLATSHGDSSFSGAYKLAAIEDPNTGKMRPVAKISEDRFKRSLPGRLQVRREMENGRLKLDVLFDEGGYVEGSGGRPGEEESKAERGVEQGATDRELLKLRLRGGKRVVPAEGLESSRDRAALCSVLLGWEQPEVLGAGRNGVPTERLVPPGHGLVLVVDAAVEEAFQRLLDVGGIGSEL